MEIHERIRKRRIELELSMRDVASALGVSPSTVSRYESSEIQNMGIDKIEALSKVLRCTPAYLMGWEDKIESDTSLSPEKTLIQIFNELNSSGQQKLLERAQELLELGYKHKKIE